MSVGNESIDNDHRKLIELINRFIDTVENERSRDDIIRIFEEPEAYTRYHFSKEERLFSQSCRDTLGQAYLHHHFEQHRYFIDKLAKLKRRLAHATVSVSIGTHPFALHRLSSLRALCRQEFNTILPYIADPVTNDAYKKLQATSISRTFDQKLRTLLHASHPGSMDSQAWFHLSTLYLNQYFDLIRTRLHAIYRMAHTDKTEALRFLIALGALLLGIVSLVE